MVSSGKSAALASKVAASPPQHRGLMAVVGLCHLRARHRCMRITYLSQVGGAPGFLRRMFAPPQHPSAQADDLSPRLKASPGAGLAAVGSVQSEQRRRWRSRHLALCLHAALTASGNGWSSGLHSLASSKK